LLPFLAFAALVGTLDDARGLSARTRAGRMAALFCLMAWTTGLRVNDLGNLLGFGTLNLGYASLGFTLLCGTGLINAINMADGVG
jgi:UDP-GlcNAc:undecaprenyl-phosphate GlcNAc-1-phosphate transferase